VVKMMISKKKLKTKIITIFILSILFIPLTQADNFYIPSWNGSTSELYQWNNANYFIPKNLTDNIYLNLNLYNIYFIDNITLINSPINIYDNISNISLLTIENNTVYFYNPNNITNYTYININQPYNIQIIIFPDNTTIFINNETFNFNYTATNIYLQPMQFPSEIIFSNWGAENNNMIISNDFDFLVFIFIFILISFIIVIYIIDIKMKTND
jgi:hypothetical protein